MNRKEALLHFITGPVVFSIWSISESCFRILQIHEWWNLSNSISFLIRNLALALLLGSLLGAPHTALAQLLSLRKSAFLKLLSPGGTALAVSILIALLLDSSHHWNAASGFLKLKSLTSQGWRSHALAAIIAVAVLACCMVSAQALSRISIRRRMLSAIALCLIPLAGILIVQGYRNSVRFSARGPIQQLVLISVDTLRADYVGAYGARVQTPVMDGIAAEGVRFVQAVSSIPQTGPSHSSMMTGLSPLTHGVQKNGQLISQKFRTIAEELRDSGFATAAFISGVPMKADFSALDQGFQEYQDRLVPIDSFNENYYGRIIAPFFQRGLLRRGEDTTDPALEWIRDHANKPFFLFLHYFDPHYPYGKKEGGRFRGDPFVVKTSPRDLPNQKRLYASEVEYVDGQIGRIVELLKELGVYDHSLLLVVSDHGESLGEHNYYYDHDRFVYEQLVRVPFLLRCPRLVKPHGVVHPQVAVLDVYQTILAAAGVEPGNRAEGQNVIPLAETIPEQYEDRAILSHSFYFEVHGLRTNSYKLISRRRRFELFDLIADPEELHNLYRQERAIASELKKALSDSLKGLTTSETAGEDLTPEQLEDLKSLGYVQ